MSQLHGKQLRNTSTSLDKLSGTGIVSFTGASMSFDSASTLTYAKTPESNFDVANKEYVDSLVQGLDIKESVKVKFDSPVTLSGVGATQGSVTLANGDRVLVNGQGSPSTEPDVNNGIWIVRTGSWERPSDFTGANTVTPGAFTFVEEGDFADSGFVLITDGVITVDTTPIKFVQFSSAGVIQAGTGMTKTGNTLDVNVDTSGLTVDSDKVSLNTTITGDRTFTGSLTLATASFSGNVTSSSNLSVTGTSTLTGAVTANNGLTINEGADITGGATVTGGVDISGFANLQNNLTVGGTSSFGGALTVTSGGATITGDVTANNNLSVTGTSTLTGAVNAQNGATVSGGLISDTINVTTLTGDAGNFTNLTVSATPSDPDDAVNLSYHGASFSQLEDLINSITDDAITGVTAGDGLSGGGTAGFITLDVVVDTSGLTVSDSQVALNTTITGGRTFSNGLTINEGADITGGATVTDGVDITGFANLQNNLTVGGTSSFGAKLTVTNGGAEITGDVIANDNLSVTGTSTLTGAVTAQNGATIQNGATVSGGVVVSDGASITGNTTIEGTTTITGDTTVNGNFTVSGTVSYVNTQELEVFDNIITLAKGNTGSWVDAGIKVDRGQPGDEARLIWNETKDLWTAGLSGSEVPILLYPGTGLTSSGATVSIDTTGFATDLAGNGLTANGGQLDINVDTSGLTISNDVVALQDTITGARTFSDGLTINNGATVSGAFLAQNGATIQNGANVSGGATVSGAFLAQGGATIQNGADITGGATVSGAFLAQDGVTIQNGADIDTINVTTIDGGTGSFTNLTVTKVADSDNDAVNFKFFNDNAIQQVTAGDGLSVSPLHFGTTGSVTLDVNTGLGLTISGDDVAMVWGGTQSGLTFSGNNAVKANVDGNTIIINSDGELEVVDIAGLKAEPVYERFTGVTASDDDILATISATPSVHSRIEVYVNGLKVTAGGNVGNLPAYDSQDVVFDGKESSWKSSLYSIETDDIIEIVYEA